MNARESMQAKEEQRAWDLLGKVEEHPQIQAWLNEAEVNARRGQRFTWAIAAGVLLTVGVGFGTYLKFSATTYDTGVGEMRDVKLPDGSKATLNTDTALKVRYSGARRYIELERGEALFKVEPEASRPFEVEAGGTLTRALGTEFNVDIRTSKVTVSVLDGAVRVAGADAGAGSVTSGKDGGKGRLPVALAKGQAVKFGRGASITEKADLKRIDAWRTRRLEFSDTPLSDAVEEFNRYSTTRLSLGSEELGTTRVSGVFRTGDADGFLFSLQEALQVEAHPSGNEIVLIRTRP